MPIAGFILPPAAMLGGMLGCWLSLSASILLPGWVRRLLNGGGTPAWARQLSRDPSPCPLQTQVSGAGFPDECAGLLGAAWPNKVMQKMATSIHYTVQPLGCVQMSGFTAKAYQSPCICTIQSSSHKWNSFRGLSFCQPPKIYGLELH